MENPVPDAPVHGTRAGVGRSKTPTRELVRAALEADPELSITDLTTRYPKFKRYHLVNALVRERKELGITTWRTERTDERVVLMVELDPDLYETLRTHDKHVGRLLSRMAREIGEKK